MEGKNILILGAGIYQYPLIKKANDLGLSTHVCSIDGKYPGFDIADHKYHVDIRDREKIVSIAKEANINAIVTCGTDFGNASLGWATEQLGLIGSSYRSSRISENKLHTRLFLKKNGIRVPHFLKLKTESEAVSFCQQHDFPCIIKMVDGSGSRGIIKVEKTEDIGPAIEQVKCVSNKDYFLIEKYIEGYEFGAQAIVQNNKIIAYYAHGDVLKRGTTSVPIGHFLPFHDLAIETLSLTEAHLAIQALEFNNCVVNIDFIYSETEQKIYIIEISPRMGATCIPEIINNFYNVDLYKTVIELSFGIHVKLNTESTPGKSVMAKLITSNNNGTIEYINTPKLSGDQLIEYKLDYAINDKIKQFLIGPDRIGHVIMQGSTYKEVNSSLDLILEDIIKITPHYEDTGII